MQTSLEDLEVSTNLLTAIFGVSKLRSLSLKFIPLDEVQYAQSPDDQANGVSANETLDFEIAKVRKRFVNQLTLFNHAVENNLDGVDNTSEKMSLELPSFAQSGSFRYLTRLTISSMFGNMNHWSAWLLGVLIGSPCLGHLSLSISHWTEIERQCLPVPDKQPCKKFFSGLCEAYGKKTTRLLKLRSLRLASPIQFPNRLTLSMLTEPKHLEELYICN